MKILVTGANGYIGSKVVKKLCDLGNEVVATDMNNTNIDKRAEFIKADIFENRSDCFSFFGKPDVCLHLAWRDGFVHDSPKHMGDLSSHYRFLCSLIDGGLKQREEGTIVLMRPSKCPSF
jgi:putative NADH-flavin reductase